MPIKTGNFFADYIAAGATFSDPNGDPIHAVILSTAQAGGGLSIADTGSTINFAGQGHIAATLTLMPNGDYTFDAEAAKLNVDFGVLVPLTAWVGIGDKLDGQGNPDNAQDGQRLPLHLTFTGVKNANLPPVVTLPPDFEPPVISAD